MYGDRSNGADFDRQGRLTTTSYDGFIRLYAPGRYDAPIAKVKGRGGNRPFSAVFSPDGKYVAYGISPGGSEDSVLHILETSTGNILPDVIDRAQFGQPSWLPDGKSFFIPRLQKLGPDAPPTAKYQKVRVYYHTLGSDPEKDPQVFGYGM